MIDAAIISTGDELTTGRTTDTNAGFIADRLLGLGIDVVAILTVGDRPERLRWAWTRGAAAGARRDRDRRARPDGRRSHDRDGRERCSAGRSCTIPRWPSAFASCSGSSTASMPENNLKQATFPEGAIIVPNALGTAPGYRVEVGPPEDRRHLVVLPGVPREMKPMMTETVCRGSPSSPARRTSGTARFRPSASASRASTR